MLYCIAVYGIAESMVRSTDYRTSKEVDDAYGEALRGGVVGAAKVSVDYFVLYTPPWGPWKYGVTGAYEPFEVMLERLYERTRGTL